MQVTQFVVLGCGWIVERDSDADEFGVAVSVLVEERFYIVDLEGVRRDDAAAWVEGEPSTGVVVRHGHAYLPAGGNQRC